MNWTSLVDKGFIKLKSNCIFPCESAGNPKRARKRYLARSDKQSILLPYSRDKPYNKKIDTQVNPKIVFLVATLYFPRFPDSIAEFKAFSTCSIIVSVQFPIKLHYFFFYFLRKQWNPGWQFQDSRFNDVLDVLWWHVIAKFLFDTTKTSGGLHQPRYFRTGRGN